MNGIEVNGAESQEVATTEVPDEPEGQASALVTLIDRLARDENVDVDKMERLLAMQERVFERRAEVAFNQAMARVQAEGVKIRRNRTNPQTKSTYADIEALSDALTPIAAREGFSLSYGTDQSPVEGWIRVTCDVAHVGGHKEHRFVDLPLDTVGIGDKRNKTDLHGAGSALSYGRRYLKLLIFDVATTDDDGNAGGGKVPETIDEKEVIKLRDWLQSLRRDEAKFCGLMGIEKLEDLPARDLERARGWLKAAEKKK